MKYSEIMNLHNMGKVLHRLLPEQLEQLFNLRCEVTEKIHGESFRVGKTKDNTYFIGQKNQFFPEGQYASHPNWYKLSETAQRDIMMVLDYCKGFYDREVVFYGELCGNGLQSGFTFPFDKYEILFIDVKVDETYWNKGETKQLIQRLGLKYIPFIGYMTLSEAMNLDVENIGSHICNEDFIEGVVIAPVEYPDFWRLQSRLIIKHKTAKFSEVAKSKKDKGLKQINWMVEYKTEFSDFVTFGRFENVLSHCRETMEVHDDMSDLRFLIIEMIKDIEKEENDGQPLDAPSRKYLGKYIPIKYKEYLNEKTNEVISKSVEPKKKTRRTKKSTEE